MTNTTIADTDPYDKYCANVSRIIQNYASRHCRLVYRVDFKNGNLSIAELSRSHNTQSMYEYYGYAHNYVAPEVVTTDDWNRLSDAAAPLLERISAGCEDAWDGQNACCAMDEDAKIALARLEALLEGASSSEYQTASPDYIHEYCYSRDLADLSETDLRNLAASLGEEALDDKVVLAFDEITVLEFWRKELSQKRMTAVV